MKAADGDGIGAGRGTGPGGGHTRTRTANVCDRSGRQALAVPAADQIEGG